MGSLCSGNRTVESKENLNDNMSQQATTVSESKTSDNNNNINNIDYTKDIGLRLHPTNELEGLTYDINKDLKLLENFYPKLFKPLVNRKVATTVFATNFEEKYINSNSFTIMQFNMLADSLSRAYMPAGFEHDKQFLGVDQRCLEWRYRGLRVLEEIQRMTPDIVCLQECDRAVWLNQYLTKLGYKYMFQEKAEAPGVRDVMPATNNARAKARELISQASNNNNNEEKLELNEEDVKFTKDGCVVFYKCDKFEIIEREKTKLAKFGKGTNDEGVVAIAVPFRMINNKNNFEFLCVTTHLKSAKTEQGEKKRETQISCLLEKLVLNEEKLPIVLCLDMNAAHINGKYEALCYNKITNGLGYKSLYKEANCTSDEMKNNSVKGERGKEPDFTTYKTRRNGTVKHTIDYIFDNGTNAWQVTKFLEIPNDATMIPDWNYPSDHFSLCIQLTVNQ